MAVFSLEALDARSGDALFVHHGDPPRLTVVDAGFAATYDDVVRPRLVELQAQRCPPGESLVIDHVIVSHIDNDHITGIVRMFRELKKAKEDQDLPLAAVRRLWHNSFSDALEAIGGPAALPVAGMAQSEVVSAGVPEGRELRILAEFFNLEVNDPVGGLLIAPQTIALDEMTVTVVGPTTDRLELLRKEWEEEIKGKVEEGDDARVAAYVDNEAPNLSSIVVHIEQGDKTMLLTGDGRGDDTLKGLEAAGLLPAGGNLHVNLLKLPHHGSDRDVESDYFERITADHYVISANGRFANPSVATLQMLRDTQGDRAYTVHLTNPDIAKDFFDADPGNYEVRVRAETEPSIVVDLEDPLG
jgi:beta-lactamase superfamily II metal-dependent hydrolase